MAHPKINYPVSKELFSVISPFGIWRKLAHYKEARRHYGIDIPLVVGTPIVAVSNQRIELVRDDGNKGFGKWILAKMKHDGREYYFFYAHLNEFAKQAGEVVDAGELIGLSGNTGGSEGPHLHFQVCVIDPKDKTMSLASSQYERTAIDPMILLEDNDFDEVVV